MSAPLGFVGAGQLGGALVRRLLELGHPILVHDVSAASLEPLRAAGAVIAASARAVADEAEIVFLCLPAPEISLAVALGEGGVRGGRAMKALVELSTLGLPTIREIAAGLGGLGIPVLDSPVIGSAGSGAIASGKFTSISAGPRALFEQVRPLYEAMTPNVFHVGTEHGQAQLCKLVSNAIGIASFTIACEAVTMGAKAGVDPQLLIDIVNTGTGRSYATENRFTSAVFKRDFSHSPLRIPAKDMQLYVETLHGLGMPALVGAGIAEIWQGALAEDPERGFHSLIEVFERFAGIVVKT